MRHASNGLRREQPKYFLGPVPATPTRLHSVSDPRYLLLTLSAEGTEELVELCSRLIPVALIRHKQGCTTTSQATKIQSPFQQTPPTSTSQTHCPAAPCNDCENNIDSMADNNSTTRPQPHTTRTPTPRNNVPRPPNHSQ